MCLEPLKTVWKFELTNGIFLNRFLKAFFKQERHLLGIEYYEIQDGGTLNNFCIFWKGDIG